MVCCGGGAKKCARSANQPSIFLCMKKKYAKSANQPPLQPSLVQFSTGLIHLFVNILVLYLSTLGRGGNVFVKVAKGGRELFKMKRKGKGGGRCTNAVVVFFLLWFLFFVCICFVCFAGRGERK